MIMIENDGWFKTNRKIIDSMIFADPNGLKIWIWMLAKARYENKPSYVNLYTEKGWHKVTVNRGEFIFGRKKAAKELCMSESMVYRWVKKLASKSFDHMISEQPRNAYTIIRINNWDKYQLNSEQVSEQPMNTGWTTNEQPMNTSKKDQERLRIPEAIVPKADTREAVKAPGGNKVVSFDIEKELSDMNPLGKNLPPMSIESDLERIDLNDIDFDMGFDITGQR